MNSLHNNMQFYDKWGEGGVVGEGGGAGCGRKKEKRWKVCFRISKLYDNEVACVIVAGRKIIVQQKMQLSEKESRQ
jgi:hypothetical protein